MGNRILVVEDAPEYREFVTLALQREGFDVESAGDGCEAMDCIQRCPPDAVICDVVMPRKTGFSLLEDVRQIYSHLPVILTSTVLPDWAVQQAQHLGATAYLEKDIDTTALLRELRNCLQKKASWSIPKPPPLVPNIVQQVLLCLENDPARTLDEFCGQAASCLGPLTPGARVRFAQAVSRAARVVIACENLEMPPELLGEPDIDAIMAFRAEQPRFKGRKVVAIAILEDVRLRVALAGQGRAVDFQELAAQYLANAQGCVDAIHFPDEGRKIELIHHLPQPLNAEQIRQIQEQSAPHYPDGTS